MRIGELLAAEELRLRLLTGDPGVEFRGVHITDLPAPGRYLSGGELVLTGLMWRRGPADSARFVAALVAAGAAALGAGLARLGHVPDDVVAACAVYVYGRLQVAIANMKDCGRKVPGEISQRADALKDFIAHSTM
ncbi:PucR family transcriptional regulator ligand-binding domain-containing protein, partial [Nonomuraea sp. 3-1Str]|uniref:PucR family transcriptional regulator ligand-binding domain-containing protein n=1 Tax=Nonomuraea sp. 3-1Str TaxID=2929801 RepID=UPI002855B661